ncbi:hypothetical protein [Methanolapillus ohkumae]|uniref:Uncharacterized protein n=1 Tax=Methanolapillus ohkumae TaxID=3028298 RepID=A0AA96ZY12_9EURY|nr:hypothetical protein MsAm2_14550 [Methanosarcinaceae archaeon Am2]
MNQKQVTIIVFLGCLLLVLLGIVYYQSLNPNGSDSPVYSYTFSNITYPELSQKSDVVLSGVVIHVADPIPINKSTSTSPEISSHDFISGGSSYSDVTILVNQCYQGSSISDFAVIRIFDHNFYDNYNWGDFFVFYLIEDPGVTKDVGPMHYLIMTPRGQIRCQNGT